jgi:hypothetical protein
MKGKSNYMLREGSSELWGRKNLINRAPAVGYCTDYPRFESAEIFEETSDGSRVFGYKLPFNLAIKHFAPTMDSVREILEASGGDSIIQRGRCRPGSRDDWIRRNFETVKQDIVQSSIYHGLDRGIGSWLIRSCAQRFT